MKPKSSLKKSPPKAPAERVVKDIRRATRRHFSAEDKIRIVLEGLRGEDSCEISFIVRLFRIYETRFRGQSLTGDSDLDSRLTFGGSLGRADWRDRRGMGSDRAVIAA